MKRSSDVAIVGGGIVGLAAAWRVSERFPGLSILVLEKELSLGEHQTGRNSGVIHSGVYYKPGSLKSKNCTLGKGALEEFAAKEDIPFKTCGKVIVAVDDSELESLSNIHERAQANAVPCSLIDRAELAEIEPHANGVKALHVPGTGVIDFTDVLKRLAELLKEKGYEVLHGVEAKGVIEEQGRLRIQSTAGEISCKYLINCAGLHADRVAKAAGVKTDVRIVPFRGEYFEFADAAQHLCKTLIYPVPDPRFPFLGVHATRGIDNTVHCGPSAVLALAREGYSKTSVSPKDLLEVFSFPGSWRLFAAYWQTGLQEMWRSVSKKAFTKALQRLLPEVTEADLIPSAPGVRAQAVHSSGKIIDDFLLLDTERSVHVLNAPSPAATASLAIGDYLVTRLSEHFSE